MRYSDPNVQPQILDTYFTWKKVGDSIFVYSLFSFFRLNFGIYNSDRYQAAQIVRKFNAALFEVRSF